MVGIIRPANVLMVGITQIIFWFFLVQPVFLRYDVTPLMNNLLFTLLMLMTMLVSAGGYIINDILDQKTDRINRPSKATIGKTLTLKSAKNLYLALNFLAFACAILFSVKTGSFNILALCATCILVLWVYSRYFKSTILMGNVVVSLLIGLVPFTFIIIESAAFQQLQQISIKEYSGTFTIIISFTLFAFFANLIREIVKDCEDFDGDLRTGLITIATGLGYQKADIFSITLNVVLIVLGLIWFFLRNVGTDLLEIISFGLLVLFPVSFLLYYLVKRKRDKMKYTHASRYSKWIMISGLIYLFIHLYKHYA